MGLTGEQALGAARKYVRDTMQGLGAMQGEPGKSAYQSALDSGFEGTEAEWIASIKGEPGDKGEKGDKGDKGEKGDTGEPGKDAPLDIMKTRDNHMLGSWDSDLGAFALFGKAKQNTTSGNQLLDGNGMSEKTMSGITFTPVEDENGLLLYVNVNGAATENAYMVLDNTRVHAKNSEYIGSGCPIGGSDSTYFMQFNYSDADGTIKGVRDVGNGVKYTDMSDAFVNREVYIYVRKGVSVSNLKFYPMIRKASITDDTYEPFTNGASPNPEFPQEIEVPSGNVVVKSCGKNLLKTTETSETKGGVTWNLSDDNHITASGTATGYSSLIILNEEKLPIKCIYTLSFKGTIENAQLNLTLYDENKNSILDINSQNENNSITIDLSQYENAEYWRIYTKRDKNDKAVNVDGYIQLERGTVVTEYEEYKETLATIPTTDFAGISVLSDGNYTDSNGQQWICDEIIKFADGSGERVQRTAIDVLDGSENWLYNNDSQRKTFYFMRANTKFANISYDNVIVRHMSDKLIGEAWNTITEMNDNIIIINHDAILVRVLKYTDVTEFKNFLSENPITVLYALAEPIRTPLTAEEISEIEKLSTFYPVTNISNDADCGMEVEYATTQTGAYVLKALKNTAIDKREREEMKVKLTELENIIAELTNKEEELPTE